MNTLRGLPRAEGSATRPWGSHCQLCASVSPPVREGVGARAFLGCCARPGAQDAEASRAAQEVVPMWARPATEERPRFLVPPQPCPRGSAHRALLREVGSPELWWWMPAVGLSPTLAWELMLWGGADKGSWKELGVRGQWVAGVSMSQSATLGLCWPKPVTSELHFQDNQPQMGPPCSELPSSPLCWLQTQPGTRQPQDSRLHCVLCLVYRPQMAVSSPHSFGLWSNVGSARPTLVTHFRFTPPNSLYSRAPPLGPMTFLLLHYLVCFLD